MLLLNVGILTYINNPSQFKARLSQEGARLKKLISVIQDDPASFDHSVPAAIAKQVSKR